MLGPDAAGIRLVPLEAGHLPAIARFAERTWARDHALAFCRWRYLEAPTHSMLLALRGDECLAVVSAFSRPYRFGQRTVTCLETADWYCLPELRLSGLGIRLMQHLMQQGQPIVSVGGSADTLKLLPRLGWIRLGSAMEYERILGSPALQLFRAARAGVATLGRTLRSWMRPPRLPRSRPEGAAIAPNESDADDFTGLNPVCGACSTVPMPMPDQFAWVAAGMRPLRRLVVTRFRSRPGTALGGWSLLRIEELGSRTEALLLDLCGPPDDRRLRGWMLAETLAVAVAAGATRIRALTSCPSLQTSLRDHRFAARGHKPIHVWTAGEAAPPGPYHLGVNVGDAVLLPYPARWPSRGAAAAGS